MAAPADGAERQRLSDFYSSKPDIELQELAAIAYSLTDIARQVLRKELTRRSLDHSLKETKDDSSAYRRLDPIVLRTFLHVSEALMAKSVLDSAGVHCFLSDDNVIRIDWFLSNALGGVKLWVRPEDFAEAREILDQNPQESFETEGIDE